MSADSYATEIAPVRGRVSTQIAVLRVWAENIYREAAKFGVIGIIAMFIDLGIFNLLILTSFGHRPLTAKVISVAVATTFAYFGNRYWTFRDSERTSVAREYILFFVLNGVGMMISLSVLWFSHYALGLTGWLADNISANIIGLALGTIFRFWSYRKWVFLKASEPVELSAEEPVAIDQVAVSAA